MSLFATTFFVLTLSALGFSCPDGWVHYGSSCYLHIWDAVTWPEAQTICALMKSCLMEIESAEENRFIASRLANLHVPKVWIGINDFAHEGRFVLTSSDRPIKYARWEHGEPNNDGHQNCVVMYRDGTWDDDYCDQSFKYPNRRPRNTFICERKHVRK
ncbi:hypothetical protein ACOMHN_025499 [Nucella lapillus]